MNTTASLRAACAPIPTGTLIDSLRLLDRQQVNAEERLVRAVICDEIERRLPAVTPLMEAWLESDQSLTISYAFALLCAVEQVSA